MYNGIFVTVKESEILKPHPMQTDNSPLAIFVFKENNSTYRLDIAESEAEPILILLTLEQY